MSSFSNINVIDGVKNINQWEKCAREQEKEGTMTQKEV
jgi:hypothetical protein